MVRTIVAGVGGAGGWDALAWAAEEAEATDARLVVVHACASDSAFGERTDEPPPDRVELADPVLAHAVGALRTRLGGQRVALRTPRAGPETVLAEESRPADLLVVGACGAGTTVRRILRRAGCPVVVVRGLPGGRGAAFAGHVVAAVDSGASGQAVLEFAFAWADRHHVPLAAVHVTAGGHAARRGESPIGLLRREVEPWAVKYPQVRVERAVLHGAVPEALVQAGIGAYLLVTGSRPHHSLSWPHDDVPLAVARTAGCPVAVVPRDHPEGDPP